MWGVSGIYTKMINGACFGLIKASKSWYDARSFCEAKNSSMLRFENPAELNSISQWLYEELKLPPSSRVWTGGYRRRSAGKWLWSTIHGGTV